MNVLIRSQNPIGLQLLDADCIWLVQILWYITSEKPKNFIQFILGDKIYMGTYNLIGGKLIYSGKVKYDTYI